MPYKEACMALVDEIDPSAAAIESVNTLVNTDGHLKAYNTDYLAVRQLLVQHQVDPAPLCPARQWRHGQGRGQCLA
jgi:shikimate dehydrogenase